MIKIIKVTAPEIQSGRNTGIEVGHFALDRPISGNWNIGQSAEADLGLDFDNFTIKPGELY